MSPLQVATEDLSWQNWSINIKINKWLDKIMKVPILIPKNKNFPDLFKSVFIIFTSINLKWLVLFNFPFHSQFLFHKCYFFNLLLHVIICIYFVPFWSLFNCTLIYFLLSFSIYLKINIFVFIIFSFPFWLFVKT